MEQNKNNLLRLCCKYLDKMDIIQLNDEEESHCRMMKIKRGIKMKLICPAEGSLKIQDMLQVEPLVEEYSVHSLAPTYLERSNLQRKVTRVTGQIRSSGR